MATVTNWIDHLSAAEVKGAIYPGVGTEGVLVIILLVIWIGWHVMKVYLKTKKWLNYQEKDTVLMITKAILPSGN